MKPIRKSRENVAPVNDNIRFPRIQVITPDGKNAGILTKREALDMAREAGLDLVLISDSGGMGVPVTKIVDFGKTQYEKKKKAAEAKKHQKVIQVKEIKLRPKIGLHDLQTKLKKAIEFLQEGKHLKLTLEFRGREIGAMNSRGSEMFEQIEAILQEHGFANLMHEKDAISGRAWSRIYFVKSGK